MRKSFKTTKRTLATAVMAALLSCGVMGTGFAAAVEGIKYDGGTLTPDSSGYITASAIMTAGGISSYLLKSDFTEFKEFTEGSLSSLGLDILYLENDTLYKSDFNEYKSNTAATLGTMQTNITDLQSGKLDKSDFTEYKSNTAATVGLMQDAIGELAATSADKDLSNLTAKGKTTVKDLAQEAINVVGDGPISVAKSDVGGVDTYTVSVKTDGKVESGDTGIVTGGTVFKETRVSGNGNHIKAANSAAKNLEALDTAIGTTADGNYVKASNSVGENLGALDAQLAALAGGAGAGLDELSHRIDNMDSKVEKVGAGAAALAALHPMDTDSKFSAAAGFGNYRGANAMALGMFYRPTDQVMFSMGGSMGNGENLLNVGVSFALDKGVSTSKAAMARTIKAQGEKISEQDAKIQTLEAENAKLAERLAAIEAKLAK